MGSQLATAAAMMACLWQHAVFLYPQWDNKSSWASAETNRSRGRDKEESGEAAESAAEGDLVATADYPTKPITMIILTQQAELRMYGAES